MVPLMFVCKESRLPQGSSECHTEQQVSTAVFPNIHYGVMEVAIVLVVGVQVSGPSKAQLVIQMVNTQELYRGSGSGSSSRGERLKSWGGIWYDSFQRRHHDIVPALVIGC